MNRPESLARRLVVGLAGPRPDARERAWLVRWRPAGVILFARNVSDREQLTGLCAELHSLDPTLEIVADHEGGPVSQLQAAIGRPPAAWTLGALDDVALTRLVHRETGRRCRAVGLDRVLAPCCDVLVEPLNPVIGSRAFSRDPEQAARHAAAAAAGLLESGLQPCAKHWPGHGGSRTDSHLGLAAVGPGALPGPFEAACDAGCDSLMIGHLLPVGTGDGRRPASLDSAEVAAAAACGGGRRLTWADDLTMGALRQFLEGEGAADGASSFEAGMLDPAQLTLPWLEEVAAAGCDRLLVRGIPWSAFPSADPGGERPEAGEDADGTQRDRTPEFDELPYEETRRRAGRAAGLDSFAASDRGLVWIDLTRDDRWLGADPGQTTRELMDRLESGFRTVRRQAADRPGSVPPADRLLVTSHRPLPEHWHPALTADFPDAGRCLVMGHPSLAAALSARLPQGWAVGALYDVTAGDYSF